MESKSAMRQVAPIVPRDVPRGKPADYSGDLTLDIYDREGNRMFAVGYKAIHVPADPNVQKAIEWLLEYGLRTVKNCKELFVLEPDKKD